MRRNADQQLLLADILMGLTSDEMLQPLFRPDVDPEELVSAVLSSRLSLSDKEHRLMLISELESCDASHRSAIKQSANEIHGALSKLGAFPGVVWYVLAQDGMHAPTYKQLMLSPDALKPWPTFERGYLDCDLFECEPQWTELWRLVSTETGVYRPDYVYYLNELAPIFFGKPDAEDQFAFIDNGITFLHHTDSPAAPFQEEYFGCRWVPSQPLPYEVGDIVNVDLRPFGQARLTCVVGDKNGFSGKDDTRVLFMDSMSNGWRLITLSELENYYQGGNDFLFCRDVKPKVSVYCGLSASSISGSENEMRLSSVRDYLLETEGFADRSARRSSCFQRDWDLAYGLGNAITDEQLDALLHTESFNSTINPDDTFKML